LTLLRHYNTIIKFYFFHLTSNFLLYVGGTAQSPRRKQTVATAAAGDARSSSNSIWSECRVRGAFSTSDVDDVVRTNMYLLDVPSDTDNMILQLHQKDRAIYGKYQNSEWREHALRIWKHCS